MLSLWGEGEGEYQSGRFTTRIYTDHVSARRIASSLRQSCQRMDFGLKLDPNLNGNIYIVRQSFPICYSGQWIMNFSNQVEMHRSGVLRPAGYGRLPELWIEGNHETEVECI